MVTLTGSYTAARHGSKRTKVTFGVLHSAETPIEVGYAKSIAKMFSTTTEDKSAHFMCDPAETWGCLDPSYVAWHVGNGNTYSIGVEQAGYAKYSTAEWTSTDGLRQMSRVATLIRELNATYGFGAYWMTDAQLLAAHKGAMGGWATHDQCRRVLGGTTHTDPMPNYPMGQLMALVHGEDAFMALTDGEQHELLWSLRQVRNQLTGSEVSGEYPGLPDLDMKTVVQYLASLGAKAQPAVNVDAGAVAAALAANPGFLSAVAKAVNDDAARRQAS